MRYIFDTNIWADLSRQELSCDDLRGKAGVELVLAPLAVIELVKGIITGGEYRFPGNKAMVQCMARDGTEVLELPRVFIFQILWNHRSGVSDVLPEHYTLLMSLVRQSNTLAQFLAKAEARESVWRRMTNIHSIHESVLDKELGSLKKLAAQASLKSIPIHMTRLYEFSGLRPDPEFFTSKFSAAIEFLVSSIAQVRNGANPAKNNRGLYVDSQFFWYLGDPDLTVVTEENFSSEIKASPQASRIISLDTFLGL